MAQRDALARQQAELAAQLAELPLGVQVWNVRADVKVSMYSAVFFWEDMRDERVYGK